MVITTILMYIMLELEDFRIVPLYKQPYTARPATTYEDLMTNAKRFRKWTNFEFDIFSLLPITKFVDQTRSYYFTHA